jgi:heterodisulfide reductase subunit C
MLRMKSRDSKWGFQPGKSNTILPDQADRQVYRKLRQQVPSLASCIFCGGCSATCTAAASGMNFRVVHLLLCRGEMEEVKEKSDPCLLCGKCTLVCPRNVDTRSAIYHLKLALYELQ